MSGGKFENAGVSEAFKQSAPDMSALEAEAAALDGAGAPSAPAESPESGAPSPPEVSTAEVLRPLLRFSFDFFAPNWKIDDTESAQLAEAYAAVLDKYFPDGLMNRWGVELNALLITFVIFSPRLKIPPRDRPPAESSEAPRVTDAPPSTSSPVPSAPPATVQ